MLLNFMVEGVGDVLRTLGYLGRKAVCFFYFYVWMEKDFLRRSGDLFVFLVGRVAGFGVGRVEIVYGFGRLIF